MKIVFISDTHGKHEVLTTKAYNNILGEGDILVHAGDCTNVGRTHEIKDFLDINRSSDLDKKVEDIVKKKFKNDKDLEKYVVDVTRNVLIQLYKTMYTRKGFWATDLKNSPN